MVSLTLALLAFVGTHFLLSHPLRPALVGRLGAGGFLGFYSLVAAATLGWVAFAFREAPLGSPLWVPGDGLWAVATALMFLASILLVGSFVGNPALPGTTNAQSTAPAARGVFAITRHPMLWSFALWALVHVLVSPRPPVLVLGAAIALLSIAGAKAQDIKKTAQTGAVWRDWMARTAFVPFAGQVSGRIGWVAAWPGWSALAGGIVLWLVATWAHPWAGAGMAAGVWRWVG